MTGYRAAVRVFTCALVLVLSACGGGGGGPGGGGTFMLDGGPVAASLSGTTAPYRTYTFSATADTAYTVSTVTASGDLILQVYHGDPFAGGTLIGYSWNSLATTAYNNVSFVANFTGTVYVMVAMTGLADTGYTVAAFTGGLAIGTSRSAATYNNKINYSFDATSGVAYQVQLTPRNGNVDIGAVNAKLAASVGSSALSGTATDSVTFLAPASQRYYVQVNANSADTVFDIRVATTSADPDLTVSVDSAVSDGTNVTVNYTVRNAGINAAGPFSVDLWSNAASAPAVGAVGEKFNAYASLAGGASVSGSAVIPNANATGTAYAVVDTANAVVESAETNNVGPGKNWTKPLLAPQNFGFESGPIPAAMVMSGNAAWAIDATTGGAASTHSLKAGTIGDSQSSCVAFFAANAVSISFDYAVSSESGFDYLRFYIDGVQQWAYAWSGLVPWSSSGAIAVTSATHEYKWCYVKDSSLAGNSDSAWIDNIVLAAAPPPTVDLTASVTSALSNGSSVTVNYTVSNGGNSASGPFNLDLWSNLASAPGAGTAGQATLALASLAAGATVSGSVNIPNVSASGTAWAYVDSPNAIVETNETNNASTGYAWTANVDLRVVVTSAVSDRSNVVVSYAVSNPGASAAASVRLDLWSNLASAPAVGTTSATLVTIPSVAAGATVTGSVSIPDAGAGGTAYAVVDTLGAIAEAIETNNVSAGVAWQAPVLAPVTYNFNNSLVPAEMVMSGDAAWVAATSGKGANTVSNLKAGTITHGQTSCVSVSAAPSISVSFDYSVSSESGFDFLRFYIDGVQQSSWSGAIASTPSGSLSAGASGVHQFKWCYTKDGSVSSGSDTAWIDNIVIN